MTLIEIMMVLSVVAAMFGLTVQMYKQCTGYGSSLKSKQNIVASFLIKDDKSILLQDRFKEVQKALDMHFGDNEYKVSKQEMSCSKAQTEKNLLPPQYYAIISDKNGTIISDGQEINEKVYLWIGSADYII
jgi:Tfp pilus assembly protein PilE